MIANYFYFLFFLGAFLINTPGKAFDGAFPFSTAEFDQILLGFAENNTTNAPTAMLSGASTSCPDIPCLDIPDIYEEDIRINHDNLFALGFDKNLFKAMETPPENLEDILYTTNTALSQNTPILEGNTISGQIENQLIEEEEPPLPIMGDSLSDREIKSTKVIWEKPGIEGTYINHVETILRCLRNGAVQERGDAYEEMIAFYKNTAKEMHKMIKDFSEQESISSYYGFLYIYMLGVNYKELQRIFLGEEGFVMATFRHIKSHFKNNMRYKVGGRTPRQPLIFCPGKEEVKIYGRFIYNPFNGINDQAYEALKNILTDNIAPSVPASVLASVPNKSTKTIWKKQGIEETYINHVEMILGCLRNGATRGNGDAYKELRVFYKRTAKEMQEMIKDFSGKEKISPHYRMLYIHMLGANDEEIERISRGEKRFLMGTFRSVKSEFKSNARHVNKGCTPRQPLIFCPEKEEVEIYGRFIYNPFKGINDQAYEALQNILINNVTPSIPTRMPNKSIKTIWKKPGIEETYINHIETILRCLRNGAVQGKGDAYEELIAFYKNTEKEMHEIIKDFSKQENISSYYGFLYIHMLGANDEEIQRVSVGGEKGFIMATFSSAKSHIKNNSTREGVPPRQPFIFFPENEEVEIYGRFICNPFKGINDQAYETLKNILTDNIIPSIPARMPVEFLPSPRPAIDLQRTINKPLPPLSIVGEKRSRDDKDSCSIEFALSEVSAKRLCTVAIGETAES